MRTLEITSKKHLRKNEGVFYFSEDSVKDGIKSCAPGEWCRFAIEKKMYIGFVNPFSKDKNNIVVFNETVLSDPRELIKKNVERAVNYRRQFNNFQKGSRLIFGESDQLPGIICDEYENVIVLQIFKAGLDLHREFIRELFTKMYDKKIVIHDNHKERAKEGLPNYELDELPEMIEIEDSEIKYSLDKNQFQKNGYYYDHRENRLKLERFINNMMKKPNKALDLFCYLGSWGIHSLKAGVDHVTFVDQADMKENIQKTMGLNNFKENTYDFIRGDVFKELDRFKNSGMKFDLIISDPPAFAKSFTAKKAALNGYDKLHLKALEILNDKSYFVAASCTKYVDSSELDQSVAKSALRANKKIKLVDIGMQGFDHPISTLSARSNYIKYLLYYVENL